MRSLLSDEVSGKMANMGLFCAVLIVMLHSGWGGLTAIAVPYFFVASGYFLAGHVGEAGWWGREVRKRIRTLLVPMWIWGCVSLMIECGLILGCGLVGYEYRGVELSLSQRVLRCFGIVFTENMGPLWFLRMLFILVVLSPMLMGRNKVIRLMWIAIFAVAYGWFELSGMPHGRLWHFLEYGISLRGLLYFSIGGFLREIPVEGVRPSWTVKVMLGIITAVLIKIQASVLVMVPVAMLAVFLLMPTRKWMMTSYSFPIYLIHMPMLLGLTAAFAMIGIRSSTCHTDLFVSVRFFCGLCGSVVLTYAIRKFIPGFARVAFGGR